MFFTLAIKSLFNRKGSVTLAMAAMAISITVLFAVEHIRHQAKENFSKSVSGVDLIVGARTGSLNLLLYSVFRIGSPTNNISWESYKNIASNPKVSWAIPISLGDSHKGFRVVGTTPDYFRFFSYGDKHTLDFKTGKPFSGISEVVLGAEVAKSLAYSLGDKLVLSHGIAKNSFSTHDNHPFVVSGILKATGTPADQTLHVSLEGIEAIHANWQKAPGTITEKTLSDDLAQPQPSSVTAIMLGLNSRMATFHVQRSINDYSSEPLTAILPGVALTELWQMMGILENTLFLVSIMVFVAALLGLGAMLLSSIRDRRNEIKLLRATGAPAGFVFLLIEAEALSITLISLLIAAVGLTCVLLVFQDFIIQNFGLFIDANILSPNILIFSFSIIMASCVVSVIPAFNAYKSAQLT